MKQPTRSTAFWVPTATLAVRLEDAEQVFGLAVAAAQERHIRLSPRETQIAVMLAAGKRSREIAADLGIKLKTLDIHRAHIKMKLEASTANSFVGVAFLVVVHRLLPRLLRRFRVRVR